MEADPGAGTLVTPDMWVVGCDRGRGWGPDQAPGGHCACDSCSVPKNCHPHIPKCMSCLVLLMCRLSVLIPSLIVNTFMKAFTGVSSLPHGWVTWSRVSPGGPGDSMSSMSAADLGEGELV